MGDCIDTASLGNASPLGATLMAEQMAQHNPTQKTTFIGQFLQTFKLIAQDKGVLMMLVFAPILYGFFYPWPYRNEVVHKIPVAIIDEDHSVIAQKIISFADASPRIAPRVVSDENQAKQLLWQEQIAGYMVIPSGLAQHVQSAQTAKVSIMGNASYFLLNKQVQTGFSEVVGTVSAGIDIQKNVAQGSYATLASQNTAPVSLLINPLYNTTEGYGSYIVPAVSILILQQMFLMGTAMLVGTWAEQRTHHAPFKTWLARILAISGIGFILGCFYYGVVFRLNDYPRNQNLLGSLGLLALFFPTVVTAGCVIGLWFKERERAMQLLVVSSMPMMFLSGVPYPAHNLPEFLQYARWLLPSTPAMNASVLLNQMGASLADVRPYLGGLAVILASNLLILLWLGDKRDKT
ncbi:MULTISPECIES: ABC transporter permease [unclassified Moraxella]|uniref:ABC transporter permease n=1 Tax=unclassified Moraxella TaxID=2685852 RepID=UPI003AF60D7A